MLNNINMEFIQAFNPLYAVPIVAVIICAFIVYAFGFKSPVQPPSFEKIEEEKKNPKKRRGKETQKSNKLIQNGKVNGSTVSKNAIVSTKKKEANEKYAASEIYSPGGEKVATAFEKKASKKNKPIKEKKLTQEKKKESFSHDELNDDGWVQLISKKGRKNRKKDDVTVVETNFNTSIPGKVTEGNKSDDPIEESPQKKSELHTYDASAQSTKDKKLIPATTKEKASKDIEPVTSEKSKIQDTIKEVSKSGHYAEKQFLKEIPAKGVKDLEESSKSKKKKKKGAEIIHPENEPVSGISELSAVQVNSAAVAPNETATPIVHVIDSPQANNSEIEVCQPLEVKTSNVAFDELAGLYPEPKEQKKRKKVRRDH